MPEPPFHDHFSGIAPAYAQFRPRYPAALFAYLASCCRARERAWDAATGNGQAALGLADHFAEVVATDLSASQIAHATPHPRVSYRVAAAESSGLEDASLDLATVAQAMHWLHVDRFFLEARRVLRPGGVLAVWAYQVMQVPDAGVQQLVDHYYARVVGPYWPRERFIVEKGYRSLRFPFAELDPPPFTIDAPMSLEEIAGYMGTWSATRRYREATGRDPVPRFLDELRGVRPTDAPPLPVRWPVALRIGTKD